MRDLFANQENKLDLRRPKILPSLCIFLDLAHRQPVKTPYLASAVLPQASNRHPFSSAFATIAMPTACPQATQNLPAKLVDLLQVCQTYGQDKHCPDDHLPLQYAVQCHV